MPRVELRHLVPEPIAEFAVASQASFDQSDSRAQRISIKNTEDFGKVADLPGMPGWYVKEAAGTVIGGQADFCILEWTDGARLE
jgi:hypothetical protein